VQLKKRFFSHLDYVTEKFYTKIKKNTFELQSRKANADQKKAHEELFVN
jgi:hypothetical protein